MRVGVINNLRAGKASSRVHDVVDLLRTQPDVPHVETHTGASVPEALAHLASHDVELLVLYGGDGTVQRTLTELLVQRPFEKVPLIAPLRGGRTNMIALAQGARRDPVRALASLLDDARNGRIAPRVRRHPVLRLEIVNQAAVHYGMFFGSGVIHRAIRLVHQTFPPGRSQGALGSGIVTGVLLARLVALHDKQGILTPDKLLLRADGQPIDAAEFSVAFATTLDRLFLRLRPFWGSEDAPLRFTALAANADRTLALLPGILRGRPRSSVTPEGGYFSQNVHRLDMKLSCGFTLDGELFDPGYDRTLRLGADESVELVRA